MFKYANDTLIELNTH